MIDKAGKSEAQEYDEEPVDDLPTNKRRDEVRREIDERWVAYERQKEQTIEYLDTQLKHGPFHFVRSSLKNWVGEAISRVTIVNKNNNSQQFDAIIKIPGYNTIGLDIDLIRDETLVYQYLHERGISGIPNIWASINADDDDDHFPGFVMDFAGSKDLKGWVREQLVAGKNVFSTLIKVGQTLDSIEKVDVALTDVKVANIMVNDSGEPTIIDMSARFKDPALNKKLKAPVAVSAGYAPIANPEDAGVKRNIEEALTIALQQKPDMTQAEQRKFRIDKEFEIMANYQKNCFAANIFTLLFEFNPFVYINGGRADRDVGVAGVRGWNPFQAINIDNITDKLDTVRLKIEVLGKQLDSSKNLKKDIAEIERLTACIKRFENLSAPQRTMLQAWVDTVCSPNVQISNEQIALRLQEIFQI